MITRPFFHLPLSLGPPKWESRRRWEVTFFLRLKKGWTKCPRNCAVEIPPLPGKTFLALRYLALLCLQMCLLGARLGIYITFIGNSFKTSLKKNSEGFILVKTAATFQYGTQSTKDDSEVIFGRRLYYLKSKYTARLRSRGPKLTPVGGVLSSSKGEDKSFHFLAFYRTN